MSREMLDRAAAAFLAHRDAKGQGAVLLRRDEISTWLLIEASGEKIAIFHGPVDVSPVELAAAFKAFVKQSSAEGTPTHFVIGGDELTARRAIREAKPTLQVAPLGFWHLDERGALNRHGFASEWLEAAAEQIGVTAPIDDEEIQRAMVRTRAVAMQQAAIASKLSGRYGVTAAITGACVALFLLRFVWPDGGDTAHLLRMGANYGPLVRAGEVWRLFAAAFLHADIVHLLANMIALWSFGTVLEALLGPRRYAVLYGVSALAGSLASAFLTSPRPSVGASGAVWGLMVAGIVMVYRPQGLLPPSMLAAARTRAWMPLALNLMYSFRPGVDFLAHIGGGLVGGALFLTGAITAGLPPLGSAPVSRRDGQAEKPWWSALAAIVVVAMGASIVAGMAVGKPWEAGKPPELSRRDVGASGLTIEVPSHLSGDVKIDTTGELTRYTFEALGDPMLFGVGVQPLAGEIPAENLEAELEALRVEFSTSKQPNVEIASPPRIETIGGRRAVVMRLRFVKEKVDLALWHFVIGARLVIVRAEIPDGCPKGWLGVEDRVAASIAPR